jgi:hypothetical protein
MVDHARGLAEPRRVIRTAGRPLFVVTILVGSFLLFLVQPMVARMALPRLGGAPNVWNSAMVVYQVLLLGGYGYAHVLSRWPLRRQVIAHLALLALAALTLPIALAPLAASVPGWEILWVPLLLLVTVGPVFFVMAAQAPLMQRWYAADDQAGEPWALYAASNLGSFAGLIAYPLLAEPLLSLHAQSRAWSLGFGALVVFVALCARSRWRVARMASDTALEEPRESVAPRRIATWLALSAMPSGLLLSTTTHLTTDVFAMPLLWVIPLGLYLLSFVVAFSGRRMLADAITLGAPALVLFAGSYAMTSSSGGSMAVAVSTLALLFGIAVALHARMYDLRPGAPALTLFYLVMSAGGALGGVFTALVAPVVFDWAWEHPLLVLAAAMLLPLSPRLDWTRLAGLDKGMSRIALAVLIVAAIFFSMQLMAIATDQGTDLLQLFLRMLLTAIGMLLLPWRWAFVALLLMMMVAQGGLSNIQQSFAGHRTRSYFGIYSVYDNYRERTRLLVHGTTLHGKQSLEPALRLEPTTYYGDSSGIGIALDSAPVLFGPHARIGIVGLGTGTLACRHQPGQAWTIFEIDPTIVRFSRDGTFTFLRSCAPDARIVVGDARLRLEAVPPHSFDVLAIDAFSSDAIPLHLLTDEAVRVYERALSPQGLLMIHVSNNYIELEPVLSAIAAKRGLHAMVRLDTPPAGGLTVASSWVALARDPVRLAALREGRRTLAWKALQPAQGEAWTDDHASILPYIRWRNIAGKR